MQGDELKTPPSGRFVLRIEPKLHSELANLARRERCTLNTLVVMLLTEGVSLKEKIKTPEMAQLIARRLGKPHGAFADFAVRWIEAMEALEQELRENKNG